jgi:transposase
MEQKRPKNTKPLKARQQLFVASMVSGATIGAACEHANVSRTQAKRWLTHPHPVSEYLEHALLESQARLAERLPKLIDLSLRHCEYVLSRPDGQWADAKQTAARTILNSTIRLMELTQQTATEGTIYENNPTND